MKTGRLLNLWQMFTLASTPRKLRFAAFGAAGSLAGMGAFVLVLSNAASYMSDDPKACINCHIMVPEYSTWQHSSHGRVTVCNDCHVPHDNLAMKYFFKAKDGGRHSFLFTFGMERQTIEAIPESKEVIQKNCLRCHENVVSEVKGQTHATFDRPCIECHQEVPHGKVHSLSSTPNAAVPPLTPVTPEWLRGKSSKKGASQ